MVTKVTLHGYVDVSCRGKNACNSSSSSFNCTLGGISIVKIKLDLVSGLPGSMACLDKMFHDVANFY